jgi:hypothetical protein
MSVSEQSTDIHKYCFYKIIQEQNIIFQKKNLSEIVQKMTKCQMAQATPRLGRCYKTFYGRNYVAIGVTQSKPWRNTPLVA